MKLEKAIVLEALQAGVLQLEGQFVYGSNYTFMVDCHYQAYDFKAVYKPVRGERPLWDFPHQTLAKREVAAYLVSEALGWELVPPTVFRTRDLPIGPGSAQLYVEHDPEVHYFTLQEPNRSALPQVALFDLLINNADRKSGHLLIDPEGDLWLIDHGLSFHVDDKLRTVIWDFAGQPIPPERLADLNHLINQLTENRTLTESLAPLLTPDEISALKKRAAFLKETGIFPLPSEDRRAYPWPLV